MSIRILSNVLTVTLLSIFASSQALNWEGQTGVFVTPLAYTAGSESRFEPVASYHFLNAGSVLGEFHQASVTVGLLHRLEFGYTRNFHQAGTTPVLSSLWTHGFNAVHGKFNFVRERTKGGRLPAISLGFVVRTQVNNVTGVLEKRDLTNADLYAVASKTFTQLRHLPVVLNGGFKVTNAALLGLAGNAPAYKGRAFGAAAFAFSARKSTVLVGAEVLQQPRSIKDLPGAVVPTTLTYAVRIVPAGSFPSLHGWGEERPRLNIDLGVAQVAGLVAPGVNLRARHQFALGLSYGF